MITRNQEAREKRKIIMGAKGLLKRGKKTSDSVMDARIETAAVALDEAFGAAKIIPASYTDADLIEVVTMIRTGQGGAATLPVLRRIQAVNGLKIMITRDPQGLGKIVNRLIADPNQVGAIIKAADYAASRR